MSFKRYKRVFFFVVLLSQYLLSLKFPSFKALNYLFYIFNVSEKPN